MEKENWIENILNSANGITPVMPDDTLFSRIQERIKHQDRVSPKTLWMAAASIAAVVVVNISVLTSETKSKNETTADYLEMTVNKSNQLY
jgi:hypothetical protein